MEADGNFFVTFRNRESKRNNPDRMNGKGMLPRLPFA